MVNSPEFFLSHRLPLAIAAKEAGYEVHVVTTDGPDTERIQAKGFSHHVVPFSRSGQNPLKELNTLVRLFSLFWRMKPSLVHLVTIKPVLYGGVAARLAGIKAVVSAIPGLGTVFLADSAADRVRRWLIIRLYRVGFKQNRLVVIFQNPDDRDFFLALKILKPEQACLIRGSGVALADYPYLAEPEGNPVILMAARLLKYKGVLEFIAAARLLRQRGLAVDIRLAGSPDPGNPNNSVTHQELGQWASEGQVKLIGYCKNMAEQYAAANIICLPSYREGLPKGLVEAAACGRAVVTTNVPGCRNAIIPGETGLLVPAKNAEALADAIQVLVEDTELRKQMGRAGRALAEDVFPVEKIVEQHMDIYKELIEP